MSKLEMSVVGAMTPAELERYSQMDALDRAIHDPAGIGRLRVVDAAGLLMAEFPPRQYILTPIIQAQSITMLYSFRGIGKTYLAMGMGLAVAAAGNFLKWSAPTPRRVLYIDGEMPGGSLKERLSGLIAGMDVECQPDYFKVVTPDLQPVGLHFPSLSGRAGQKLVEDELADTELLIIDNLSCLTTGIENEAESWIPMQEWALSLRRRGVSVLFLHHAGKGGAQRGTSKREDILDTVITLKRPADYTPSEGARFEVHFEKCRGLYGVDVEPFEARLATDEKGTVNWTVAEIENTLAAEVASLIASGCSVRKAGEILKISKSNVQRLKGGIR